MASQAEREKLATAFAHPGVAQAYQYRPPYPPETFDILERAVADRPADVLDIGAGEGATARPPAARVNHLDALDMRRTPPMACSTWRSWPTSPGGRIAAS